MHFPRFVAWISPLAVGLALVGCGSDSTNGDSSPQKPADVTVEVLNNKYVAKDVTIKKGQTVEWVFKQGSHDVVSGTQTGTGAAATCAPDGKFASDLKSSGTFRHTFDETGTVPYFCTPHCTLDMVGTVTVTD